MAKKLASKKSFKSLFSRSEANLSESVDKDVDKNDGEKKKFKFFKFKTKQKHDKSSTGSEQTIRSLEPGHLGEDGDVGVDVGPDIKRASLYATAPRSKDKEINISELDGQNKSKKFATLSFGFKKKKKKEEDNLSKSTFVLNEPGVEEPFETPVDLSQMKLDPTNAKRFSMSQPELDTSPNFNIPSPPAVTTNHSKSYFTLTNQPDTEVPVITQTVSEESLTNGFDIHKEPLEAPIATIGELHDPDLSVKKIVPNTENTSVVSTVTTIVTSEDDVKREPAPIVPQRSSLKPAAVDLVSTGLTDEVFLKPIGKKEGSGRDLVDHQPDESNTTDAMISSAINDKKEPVTDITTLTPTLQNDKSSFSREAVTEHQEVSTTQIESDITTVSSVSGKKKPSPIQDGVYGALYDSLFPQNFTADVVSSMLNPEYQTTTRRSSTRTDLITVQSTYDSSNSYRYSSSRTTSDAVDSGFSKTEATIKEIKPPDTKREPILVKILKESTTETNFIESREADANWTLISPDVNAEIRSSDLDNPKTWVDSNIQHSYKSTFPDPVLGLTKIDDDSVFFTAQSSEVVEQHSEQETRREPVLIKILKESHTETNFLESRESDANRALILPERNSEIRSSDLNDLKTRAEMNIQHSYKSASPKPDAVIDDDSAFFTAKSSAVEERHSEQETRREPVLIKILRESHTETNFLESRESDADRALILPEMNPEIRSYDLNDLKTRVDSNVQHSYRSASPKPDAVIDDDSASFTAKSSEIREEAETRREPVLIKYRNERHTETNFIHSSLPTETDVSQGEMLDSKSDSGFQQLNDSVDGYSSSIRGKTTVSSQYLLSSFDSSSEVAVSDSIPHSGVSRSLTENFPDSSAIVHHSFSSVSVSENAPPPLSTSVTPHETNAHVTESKHRVILIKQLVTAETSDAALLPPPAAAASNGASEVKGIVIKVRMESLSDRSGSMDVHDGLVSPTYLSVGSDDGSATEVYYSAEEDNAADSANEEVSPTDARETTYVVDVGKDAGRDKVLTRPQDEIRDQVTLVESERKTRRTEFYGSHTTEATSPEEQEATRPQTKAEVEEVRKEEFLATPVQQVNTLVVCDFAPPSNEQHREEEGGGSEGNKSTRLEIEDHVYDMKDLLSQGGQEKEYIHTDYSYTTEQDVIPPIDNRDKESEEKQSAESISILRRTVTLDSEVVRGNLTHSTEPQSDAAEAEHNSTPPSSEWVDPITHSSDTNHQELEQVAVVVASEPNADARPPDPEAAQAEPETPGSPAEDQDHLNDGFLTELRSSAVKSETQEVEDSEAKMSVYSSLSTKITFTNSTDAKEGDSQPRYHKVSLMSEEKVDPVGFDQELNRQTRNNRADVSLENKGRTAFKDVTRYRAHTIEDSFSGSHSDKTPASSYSNYTSSTSSSLPEAPTYKHAFSTFTPEEHVSSLTDRTLFYMRHDSDPAERPIEGWRRSFLPQEVEEEEPAAPAGEREGRDESEAELQWQSPLSTQNYYKDDSESLLDDDDEASRFTGVFKATYVQLIPDPAAPPSTPPASPEDESPGQCDIANLMDTLKNMGPSFRPRMMSLRPPAPVMSSLPPIVEDASSPINGDFLESSLLARKMLSMGPSKDSINGLYTLPANLGLRKNSRDSRSPLELMKTTQEQQQSGTKDLVPPLRASLSNSIVMRTSSDSSPEDFQSSLPNGNPTSPPSNQASRLDKSVLFGSLRSSSMDASMESGNSHHPLLRTSSLPDAGPLNTRMSAGPNELGGIGGSIDLGASRSERLSFYMKPVGSSSEGNDLNLRMSRPPSLGIGSPPVTHSPTILLSPNGSIDLQRPFTNTDSAFSMLSPTSGMGMGVGAGTLGTPLMQHSLSHDGTMGIQGPMFGNMHGGVQFENQEPDRTLVSKYRAFPDAYLTKEKEHGKLNPRPGKMYIFDRPGMCGQRIEIRSDVVDATPWELQETISIRVVRGGWVLYEKPNFKGEKIALDEGDIEITCPFRPPEEPQPNGEPEAQTQNGEKSESEEQEATKAAPRFIIGSIRRAVRDYSVPEISLFPEENAEGKKVIFRDTSDDARIFGFPVKANSIIINAGLWLVYAHPFFQGAPRVLEVGGYTNPAAWGVEQPYVGSLHPLKVGEPRVENLSEPQMVIHDKPYFSGKSRTITSNTRDFMTRIEAGQTAFMYNIGSLKVLGGIWVGYEKEGFRGHQYLLEEGEYHDWRVWGGCNAELRSVRVIRADLTDPVMMMLELPDEEQEDGQQDNTFEVTEAIPDVELFGYKTNTRSIQVLSGAWVAYSHVDFSGSQYILEKGFYNNSADWGSPDSRICSVQPILLAPSDTVKGRDEIILYSQPDFLGDCHVFDRNQEALPEKLVTKSCRVVGGSWVLHEEKQYSGNMFVLSEGEYPNLTSMGCPPGGAVRSARVVPMTFSVPSISLFGLECLEGREITTETEIISMVEEGFNNHILSLRVNRGCWVLCEHSNYRGRQFFLEPIEITNWLKFSSLSSIGSMYPIRQKRHFFRVKNQESGNYLSIQGGVEEMKSGRVVATAQVEPMSDIWYYQEGLLKNKLSPSMALQAMGNIEPGTKVVLWAETRQPIQNWAAQMRGLIASLTFPGVVLDVKGGKTYDKDHVVIMPENEERGSQQWQLELI